MFNTHRPEFDRPTGCPPPRIARTIGTALLALIMLIGGNARSALADRPEAPVPLADYVPGDARIFIELRNIQAVLETPIGGSTLHLLANWMHTVNPEANLPYVETGESFSFDIRRWRRMFSETLELSNPRTAELLFSGRIALAADSWSGLPNAILIAEPVQCADLETLLETQRIAADQSESYRRYLFTGEYELACDGRVVVVGKSTIKTGLYARTLDSWNKGRDDSLGSSEEFRTRLAALPGGSQLILYTTRPKPVRDEDTRGDPTAEQWKLLQPDAEVTAIGLTFTTDRIMFGISRRLAPGGPRWSPNQPPLETLSQLPSSVLAAWSRNLNYLELLNALDRTQPDSTLGFYGRVLQTDIPRDRLEEELLTQLVGDTVFVLSQKEMEDDNGTRLRLPVVGAIIPVQNTRSTGAILMRMADNLARLMNLADDNDQRVAVEREPVDSDININNYNSIYNQDETLHRLALRRLFIGGGFFSPFKAMELGWAIHDGKLILATDRALVRDIVQAEKAAENGLPIALLERVLQRIEAQDGQIEWVLTARPQMVSDMLYSWLAYIKRYYPEMYDPQWWRRLHRKRTGQEIRLGILADRELLKEGVLEVVRPMPDWPAWDHLQAGDRILAVDGQSIDITQPAESLNRILDDHDPARPLQITILRQGDKRTVEIPLPPVEPSSLPLQPMDMLHKLAALLDHFGSASFVGWRTAPNEINLRLDLSTRPPGRQP